jgi:transposase
MTAPKATCPDCGQPATRIHSGYQRTLADLPWATTAIRLLLYVRRFFCPTPTCERQTFTERLPGVAPLYARTTTRLAAIQASTGLALAGSAGARPLARQGLPGSRNTVLRRVRQLPTPAYPSPHVVGIDDWAYRKGHRYGTIVVDLERGGPIDILADRSAETVASWLEAHPDVRVVARDRSEAYAAGIRQGAPDAVQVADRFHLLTNLAEALELVFSAHGKEREAFNEAQSRAPVIQKDGSVAVPVPPPPRASTAQNLAEQRRARRLATYEQVRALRRQGGSGNAIARQVGIGKSTVFRSLRSPAFPERKGHRGRGRSLLNAYKTYLLKRWNEGCRDALRLFHELRSRGYRGSYATVARYAQRLRQAQGLAPRQRRTRELPPAVAEPTKPPLTARSATWLIMRREEKRDEDAKQQVAQLQHLHSELAQAIALTQDFAPLVRQRLNDQLDAWLERATTCGLKAFQGFANGLREDYQAVKAGLTFPWSTGPVEGNSNRLKMLKRQRYGRAKLAVLRQRVLYAA